MMNNSSHSATPRAIRKRVPRPSILVILGIAVVALAIVAAILQMRGNGVPDKVACQALSDSLPGQFTVGNPSYTASANGQTCEGTDGSISIEVIVVPESHSQSPSKLYDAQLASRKCVPVAPQPVVLGADTFYSCRLKLTSSTFGGIQTVALEAIGGTPTYVLVRFTSDQETFPDRWSAAAAAQVLAYLANNADQAA